MENKTVPIGTLARDEDGAFKIGPFGSSLKKSELVSSGIPVAGIENVLPNNFVQGFRRFITARKFADLADYEIRPGDVLVTTMGTIGRAAVAPAGLGPSIIDSHLFRMRFDLARVEPRYVCYAINSNVVVNQLAQKARGAIMDGLNTTILRECVIPLPDLPEQRRIVGILEKANRLRRTRHFALEATGQLLRSIFRQLFGEPVAGATNFPLKKLEELIDPQRPITYGILKPGPDIKSGVPYVRVTDIRDGLIFADDLRTTSLEIDQVYRRSRLNSNDLLLSIRGQVGRLAIVPTNLHGANITQDTARLAPDEEINVRYLKGCLASDAVQRIMERKTKGDAVQGINLGDVKELLIPVPPMPLQERFAALDLRTEALVRKEEESLRQAEHLVHALGNRFFAPEAKETVPA